MKIRIALFSLILTVGSLVQAQDIHFSQFYMSPLNLNPAMTGIMNCNQRLVANFRNQWASVLRSNAYNTFSASYDQKIEFARSDYFGVGGTLWGDVAGSSKFSTLAATLSGSYSKYLGGGRDNSNYLVLGAQVGIRQRSIKPLFELFFGDQFDPSIGGPSGTSIENNNGTFGNNYSFMDVNAGLLYFRVFNETNSLWIGGAINHLNKPNQSFYDDQFFELSTRYTVHGGAEITLNTRYDVLPGFVVLSQGEAFQVNSGASVRMILSKSRWDYQAAQIGVWMRIANSVDNSLLSDALIISTKFDYDQFGIGFSYDVNLSSLRPASNGNGAFEFSLIYNICRQERRNVYCPKF